MRQNVSAADVAGIIVDFQLAIAHTVSTDSLVARYTVTVFSDQALYSSLCFTIVMVHQLDQVYRHKK